MVDRSRILQDQGIQNNQQIMAIILEMNEQEASKDGNVFDKLQAAKNDAMTLLRKNDSYMDVRCKWLRSFVQKYNFGFFIVFRWRIKRET